MSHQWSSKVTPQEGDMKTFKQVTLSTQSVFRNVYVHIIKINLKKHKIERARKGIYEGLEWRNWETFSYIKISKIDLSVKIRRKDF